jgi:hypothetical protein
MGYFCGEPYPLYPLPLDKGKGKDIFEERLSLSSTLRHRIAGLKGI